jgi:hypothetical protein
MFEFLSSHEIDLADIPDGRLRRLKQAWDDWREWRDMPPLSRFDAASLGENVGRTHLVEVLGPTFRFLHYGAMVTNPDAMDMGGRTTADYRDQGFRALVESHYGEVAKLARPICRVVIGRMDGQPYEYIRLVLPLGQHGEVTFLIVGTQRRRVPAALDRPLKAPTPAETLRSQAEKSRRLARGIGDVQTRSALEAIAVACEMRAAEVERLAALEQPVR